MPEQDSSIPVHDSSRLILSAQEKADQVILTWMPSTDSLWSESLKSSFTVVRKNDVGSSEVLATGLKPYSQSWFEENRSVEGGWYYSIGETLYDYEYTTLTGEDEKMNYRERYHLLMPEVIRDPDIGELLGLSYRDTTVIRGQQYHYEVYFEDSLGVRHGSEIIVDFTGGEKRYNRDTLDGLKFSPPDGISLMDMQLKDIEMDQLFVVGKAYGDSIVLRWAPSNPAYWNRTRGEAYGIFRIETKTEGDSTFMDYVLKDTVATWRLEDFTPERISRDSLVLIAAQCMYGEHLSKEEDGILTQHSEYVMRYGMAVLAADRSPLAATALGLRWVDHDVVPGASYQYLIMTRAANFITENGFHEVINVRDTIRVRDFSFESGDGSISLKWNKSNDLNFTGYLLYRSDDGGDTFQSLLDQPLLYINKNQDEHIGDYYSYKDSIPQNYYPYYYQISGIDPFGDTCEVVTLEAHGIDLTPPPSPLVYFAETDETGQILLKWEINDEAGDLDRFHVLLGESVESDFIPIAIDLPKTTRSYMYEELLFTDRSYYFTVVALDTAGNASTTLPIYVHLIDTIPPAPPAGLIGMIDSTGLVTITWDHNDESDLIGYRVYMANNPDHEFSQITQKATIYNLWYDTITLEALDKEVYYKIVAEDRSHNYSEFSEILTLDRPDIIPPAAPASLPASSDAEGIHLFWQPSPSNDVTAYLIYRQNMTEKDSLPQRIARLSDPEAVTWRDTTAVPEVLYEYTIQAQDQSGLLSDLAFPVKGRRRLDLNILDVQTFQAEFRQEYDAAYLRWEYEYPKWAEERLGEVYYYIYRKNGEESWEKIKQVEASLSQYLDRELSDVANITYGIKVVTQNGKSGKLTVSPSVEISK